MFLKVKEGNINRGTPKIENYGGKNPVFFLSLFSSSIVVWTEFTFEDTTNTPNVKF